jgi:hypothetical protein
MGSFAFFAAARVQLAILAVRYVVPAIYAPRVHVEAGGLLSYGPNFADGDQEFGPTASACLPAVSPWPLLRPA